MNGSRALMNPPRAIATSPRSVVWPSPVASRSAGCKAAGNSNCRITAAAALAFAAGRDYREAEVNAHLKEWLAGQGCSRPIMSKCAARSSIAGCSNVTALPSLRARRRAQAWQAALDALAGVDLPLTRATRAAGRCATCTTQGAMGTPHAASPPARRPLPWWRRCGRRRSDANETDERWMRRALAEGTRAKHVASAGGRDCGEGRRHRRPWR